MTINACFISYRHTDPISRVFVQAFAKQLQKQLGAYLPGVPIYFDKDGLKVGDKFSEELANELCRSACMVMFFLPLHFDLEHPYCALEYRAMLDLERRRQALDIPDLRNKGLIFPVVYRGLECLPTEIKSSRTYLDFDHVLRESDFQKRDCQLLLKELSKQIFHRYRALCNANAFSCVDCNQYRFPDRESIKGWLEEISELRVYSMPR